MATAYNRYTGSGSVSVYNDIVDDLFYVNDNDNLILDTARSSEAADYRHYWTEVVHASKTSNPYKLNENGALTTDFTPPTKTARSNWVVESAVPFSVTKREQAIAGKKSNAGVRSAWETAKYEAQVELKDGVEFSLLRGTGATGDAVSVASDCDGLMTMASNSGTAAYNTNISGGEAAFQTGLNTNRAAGGMTGKKKTLVCSYTNRKLIVANWQGRADAVNGMDSDKKIYADVEIYVSQFGPIVIIGHSMAADTGMVLYDANRLSLRWLYPTQTVEVPNTKLAGSLAVANCLTIQYDNPSTLMYMTIS